MTVMARGGCFGGRRWAKTAEAAEASKIKMRILVFIVSFKDKLSA
jgi:hypothetical protein